jgi:hypothetical protein
MAAYDSAQLLGFVLKNQFVFEAIKRAHDEPTDENIEEMQREIAMLVARERADVRDQFFIWAVIRLALHLGGIQISLLLTGYRAERATPP